MRKLNFEKKEKRLLIGLVLIVIILILITLFVRLHSNATNPKNSPLASAFESDTEARFTNLAGEEVALDEYFGKTVVVYVWATWCPSCHTDLYTFAEFSRLQSKEDVQFIAINRSEQKYLVDAFIEEKGSVEGLLVVLDPNDTYFKKTEGVTTPELLVFNEKGEVVFSQKDQLDLPKLQSFLLSE